MKLNTFHISLSFTPWNFQLMARVLKRKLNTMMQQNLVNRIQLRQKKYVGARFIDSFERMIIVYSSQEMTTSM